MSYALVAVVSAAIAFVLGMATKNPVNYFSSGTIISQKDKLNVIRELIKVNYIGELDEDALIEAAARAMVEAVGDQWSYYMTAGEYKTHQEDTKNQYEGIGVTVEQEKRNGGFVIAKIESGGGGERAGIQIGDIITHVEGESVANMTTSQARERIRGKAGTRVELTIDRNGTTHVLLVDRGEVAIRVAVPKLLGNGIGLITIANFDDRCAKETIAAIESLQAQGAKALIFDVRKNPGGYKHELVELLDYLLPEGVLFSSESTDGKKSQDTSNAACLKLPMAVLVDKNSYSAAEFFAAALAEYDWAVTVGEHTTGKGYFQTNINLSDGSAIHLSVGKYFTPKGVSLAEVGGIAPAVEVVLNEENAKLFAAGTLQTEKDPQIQAAVNALLKELK